MRPFVAILPLLLLSFLPSTSLAFDQEDCDNLMIQVCFWYKAPAGQKRQEMSSAANEATTKWFDANMQYGMWAPNRPPETVAEADGRFNIADGRMDSGCYWENVSNTDWNTAVNDENLAWDYYNGTNGKPQDFDLCYNRLLDARAFYIASGSNASKATGFFDEARHFYQRVIDYMNEN